MEKSKKTKKSTEFRVITTKWMNDGMFFDTGDRLEKSMNEYSRDGWEFVAFLDGNHAIFKKQ